MSEKTISHKDTECILKDNKIFVLNNYGTYSDVHIFDLEELEGMNIEEINDPTCSIKDFYEKYEDYFGDYEHEYLLNTNSITGNAYDELKSKYNLS